MEELSHDIEAMDLNAGKTATAMVAIYGMVKAIELAHDLADYNPAFWNEVIDAMNDIPIH